VLRRVPTAGARRIRFCLNPGARRRTARAFVQFHPRFILEDNVLISLRSQISENRNVCALVAVIVVVCAVGWYLFGHQDFATARMQGALLGGGMAALATALGTLPILFSQNFSQRTYDSFLGFGAGVMLAAASFSLVVPAIVASKEQGASAMTASLMVGGGILLGSLLILLLARVPTHNLLDGAGSAEQQSSLRRAWLFVAAVALHNVPEGLAIGVAYAGIDVAQANSLATGVSIQDVPEGLVVALALRTVGYGKFASIGLGIASGLVEPVAAVFGVMLIGISATLLPWGLAMAAGAMLFVICHEIIPESQKNGFGRSAMMSLVLGFIVMMVLDTSLS
jgi:ZIP family zinc transporter